MTTRSRSRRSVGERMIYASLGVVWLSAPLLLLKHLRVSDETLAPYWIIFYVVAFLLGLTVVSRFFSTIMGAIITVVAILCTIISFFGLVLGGLAIAVGANPLPGEGAAITVSLTESALLFVPLIWSICLGALCYMIGKFGET